MSRGERADRIRSVMETDGEAVSVRAIERNKGAGEALDSFEESESLRETARDIKEQAIENLPSLIDTVTEAVEANGGSVYVAQDAADANRYVASVMADNDAETIAKSKSMTTEEIDLNDHLKADGYEVAETDLGEFVVQIADETPSHLIGPSMHRSTESIAQLFNEVFDPEAPFEADPEELTEFARKQVGQRILEADVGLTGANFVAAESGTICLVTNEGNARKTAVTPPVHIAVAGIEKLLPTVSDVRPFIELIGRSGTGQDITSYVSLISPPVETPTVDFDANELGDGEEREFHLVLLDNGRTEMRADEQLRETLYCIRCGACANTCANFQSVGGHAFGGETYTGGIGTGWEAGVHGPDAAEDMKDLCTGCSRCVPKCPVKIDIPWINTVVRSRLNQDTETGTFDFLVDGLTPDEEPAGVDVQKRVFGNIDTVAKLGSIAPSLSNMLANTGPVRSLLERAAGIDHRRALPTFADETFQDWFEKRGSRVDSSNADRTAILYPDVYTNYFAPERGRATVRVLEALDVAVRVPSLPESGRAPLSQGMIETADERASDIYERLAEHIDAERDIVVIEPSDLAMFRDDYEKFLPARSAEHLAENSYEVLEYVYGLLENGGDLEALAGVDSDHSLAYHSHCQQRTLDLAAYTVTVLERVGYDVETTSVECCGMAGSFGYKQEYYELSTDIGDRLNATLPPGQIVASGTSCRDQLAAFTETEPPHPIELLDPRSN
ncbi:LUD domain-containing protein [Natronorubrum sediminis]